MSHHLLAIGAHAGDMEITAGGVIAKYVQAGHRATLLHLTPGEKGHPTLPPTEYRPQKIAEAERAAALLGADLRWLDYSDAELPVSEEVQRQIADLIRELQPTLIITHWSHSLHPDHTHTHHNVLAARFYAGLKWLARERPAHWAGPVYFAENWEDPTGFKPYFYLDITATFEIWQEAVRQYALFRGEIVSFPYLDYYESLARVRGAEAGFRYAEAFAVEATAKKRCVALFP